MCNGAVYPGWAKPGENTSTANRESLCCLKIHNSLIVMTRRHHSFKKSGSPGDLTFYVGTFIIFVNRWCKSPIYVPYKISEDIFHKPASLIASNQNHL